MASYWAIHEDEKEITKKNFVVYSRHVDILMDVHLCMLPFQNEIKSYIIYFPFSLAAAMPPYEILI